MMYRTNSGELFAFLQEASGTLPAYLAGTARDVAMPGGVMISNEVQKKCGSRIAG
jgi:hypothetical protein